MVNEIWVMERGEKVAREGGGRGTGGVGEKGEETEGLLKLGRSRSRHNKVLFTLENCRIVEARSVTK